MLAGFRIQSESERVKGIVITRYLKDGMLILVGIISASIGLKGFLLPNHFLDGGVTGISLLMRVLTGIDLSLLIILINIPFIVIGNKQVSGQFAAKTVIAICALAIAIEFVEVPPITDDKLLIAAFGGIFLGIGIGFTIRGGAVIDGTEVLAIYVSRRSALSVGDFIALFNLVLFSFAALLVSLETVMYSMLTYFAASRTVDFILSGMEEYIGVTIISNKAERIQDMIVEKLGCGITAYRAESGFGKTKTVYRDSKILFCVITRLEVSRLLLEIDKIDRKAFVVQHMVKDTKGGMIKKRHRPLT